MVVVGFTSNLGDFGMGNYLVQLDKLNRSILSKIILSIVLIALLLALFLVLISDLVAGYYGQPKLTDLMPSMSVYLFFLVLSQFFMSLLQRIFAFKLLAIGEIFAGFISTGLTIFLAILGYEIWSIVIGQIVSAFSKFLFFVFPVMKYLSGLPHREDGIPSDAKSFAFFQTGERALNYLGANFDKMFIGKYLGDTSLGIYSLPFQLVMKPIAIINPIFTRVGFPAFVRIKDDNSKLIRGYLELLSVNSFVLLPIFLFIAFSSNVIVSLIFGPKWSDASPILYYLSFLAIFKALGNPLGTLILSKGKANWSFYWNSLATAIYLVIFWIGSHMSSLYVAKLFLFVTVSVLYPLEFYFRFRLVRMTAVHYFDSMGHIMIAAIIPIGIHLILVYNGLNETDLLIQGVVSLILTFVFFIYLLLFNKGLYARMIQLLKLRR